MFGLKSKRYLGPERRNYDAFISYRRDSGSEAARLLRLALTSHGYQIFLDVDDLPEGHFDDRLMVSIANSRGFVAVLAPGSLDRVNNPEDWLFKEISRATETDRILIPLIMPKFSFPESGALPKAIQNLARLNSVQYSHEYFEAMVHRIVERLGPPKPDSPMRPADLEATAADRITLGKTAKLESRALRLYEEAQDWLESQVDDRTQIRARAETSKAIAQIEARKAAARKAEQEAAAAMSDEIRSQTEMQRRKNAALTAELEANATMLNEFLLQFESEEKRLAEFFFNTDATMLQKDYDAAVAAQDHIQRALQDARDHISRIRDAARTGDRNSRAQGEQQMAKMALSSARVGLRKFAAQFGN